MNRHILTIALLVMINTMITAQDTDFSESTTTDLSMENSVQQDDSDNYSILSEDKETETSDNITITENNETSSDKEKKNVIKTIISPLKVSATVDMQVDKEMYDELSSRSDNRFYNSAQLPGLRKMVDDFWIRVAIRMSYKLKFFESAFALRFYPYWTMRKFRSYNDNPSDLNKYLDMFELNQAYLKMFKDYSYNQFNSKIHLKIGRDGLLNGCSQLFGNYLDQPAGGYGDSKNDNITGPFKNRKVFANQMEVGLKFNLGKVFGSQTSAMIGGNLNNEKWYGAPTPIIFQQLDSKLNAGFFRGYQDFYLLDERIHLGGGIRIYKTKVDSSDIILEKKYINAQWAFDITIIPDLKIYTEMAFQKLGSTRTGIVRPINIGITIPTGKVLDVLAIELENVANTFFSDESMRDAVGRFPTKALAWGMVAEKIFYDRVSIAWGLYTGNPTGDMKTSLRIASDF